MTPIRRLVAFAVVAMLVWGVAFGGGYTVALFTSNVEVSGTFETVAEFDEFDGSDASGEFESALDGGDVDSTGNATDDGPESANENVTAPPNEKGSTPPENGSIEDGTDTTEQIGNSSSTPDASTGNESDSGSNEPTDAVPNDDEPDDTDGTGSDESTVSDEEGAADDSDGDSSDATSSTDTKSPDGKSGDDSSDDTDAADDAAADGHSGEP